VQTRLGGLDGQARRFEALRHLCAQPVDRRLLTVEAGIDQLGDARVDADPRIAQLLRGVGDGGQRVLDPRAHDLHLAGDATGVFLTRRNDTSDVELDGVEARLERGEGVRDFQFAEHLERGRGIRSFGGLRAAS
jgi:hypothetical protein